MQRRAHHGPRPRSGGGLLPTLAALSLLAGVACSPAAPAGQPAADRAPAPAPALSAPAALSPAPTPSGPPGPASFLADLEAVPPAAAPARRLPGGESGDELEGEVGSDLGPWLQELCREHGVPALVAVVTGKERPLAAGAAGVRRLGGGEAVSVDDPMHIGSVTKPITATLLAQLVEEGKLAWDTPLAKALPRLAPDMRAAYRKATVADLLSHQAGIPPFMSPEQIIRPPAFPGGVTEQRRAFSRWVLGMEPILEPGEAYFYSNAGFVVAGAIAEAVTGESWEELVSRRIFKPLGMGTAGFGWPAAADPDAPWGHQGAGRTLIPHDPTDRFRVHPIFAPAGDVHLSMPDLAKFARLHLAGYDGEGEMLRPATFRTLHTPRLRNALGWGITSLLGHEPVSTYSGSALTFATVIVLVHDADVAVVITATSAHQGALTAMKTAVGQLVERYAGGGEAGP